MQVENEVFLNLFERLFRQDDFETLLANMSDQQLLFLSELTEISPVLSQYIQKQTVLKHLKSKSESLDQYYKKEVTAIKSVLQQEVQKDDEFVKEFVEQL